jgi:hypothetical protein
MFESFPWATTYGIHCIVCSQFSQYFVIRERSQLLWGGHGFSVGILRYSDPHDRPFYICGKGM